MLAYDERTDDQVFKIEFPDAEVVLPQLEGGKIKPEPLIEIMVAVLVAVLVLAGCGVLWLVSFIF